MPAPLLNQNLSTNRQPVNLQGSKPLLCKPIYQLRGQPDRESNFSSKNEVLSKIKNGNFFNTELMLKISYGLKIILNIWKDFFK